MPYREEKPLGEIIPPDRRRAKMFALIGIGMLAGAGLLYALQQATKDVPTITGIDQPQPTQGAPFLQGPDGSFSVPSPFQKTVVNVWLQGCADCMPAFDAMKKLESEGGLDPNILVINVAYGTADPAWAARYGVRKNLVFDHGGAKIVKPLGISTFTTLVYDENGKIIARDRPDRPGYAERIRALAGGGPPLDAKDVEAVVAAKRRAIRDACWRGRTVQEAYVTVTAVIGGDGSVVSSSSTGSDPEITSCIENEVRGWRFRATGGARRTVDIPFKLRRDD